MRRCSRSDVGDVSDDDVDDVDDVATLSMIFSRFVMFNRGRSQVRSSQEEEKRRRGPTGNTKNTRREKRGAGDGEIESNQSKQEQIADHCTRADAVTQLWRPELGASEDQISVAS